jgi:hypothetical protein
LGLASAVARECGVRGGRSIALQVAARLKAAIILGASYADIASMDPRDVLSRLLEVLEAQSGELRRRRFNEVLGVLRDVAETNRVDTPVCAGILAASFAGKVSAVTTTASATSSLSAEVTAARAAAATLEAAALTDGGLGTHRALAAATAALAVEDEQLAHALLGQVLRANGGLPVLNPPAAEAGLLLAAWRRYHAAACPEGIEIVLGLMPARAAAMIESTSSPSSPLTPPEAGTGAAAAGTAAVAATLLLAGLQRAGRASAVDALVALLPSNHRSIALVAAAKAIRESTITATATAAAAASAVASSSASASSSVTRGSGSSPLFTVPSSLLAQPSAAPARSVPGCHPTAAAAAAAVLATVEQGARIDVLVTAATITTTIGAGVGAGTPGIAGGGASSGHIGSSRDTLAAAAAEAEAAAVDAKKEAAAVSAVSAALRDVYFALDMFPQLARALLDEDVAASLPTSAANGQAGGASDVSGHPNSNSGNTKRAAAAAAATAHRTAGSTADPDWMTDANSSPRSQSGGSTKKHGSIFRGVVRGVSGAVAGAVAAASASVGNIGGIGQPPNIKLSPLNPKP